MRKDESQWEPRIRECIIGCETLFKILLFYPAKTEFRVKITHEQGKHLDVKSNAFTSLKYITKCLIALCLLKLALFLTLRGKRGPHLNWKHKFS